MFRFLLACVLAAALPLHADRVRVVIAVAVPQVSTYDANAAGRPSAQPRAQAVRASVIDSLATATHVEPWGRGAVFAAEVDRATFEQLAHDPRIRAVSIDDGGEGALLDSIRVIGADVVHVQGYDGSGVTVAVLDSGIDASSPNFAGRIAAQQCFCDNLDGGGCCPNGDNHQSGAGSARDDNGHGTHVSGIVAGGGATAPAGVAPGARLVAVKVLDADKRFRSFTQIYRALEWIAAERPDVKVINMSFGSWSLFAPSDCDSAAIAIGMDDVVTRLRARGVLIAASAGNQSSLYGTTLPACMRDVIGVGATYDVGGNHHLLCDDDNAYVDEVTCFSNSTAGNDLLAPGALITAAGKGGGFVTMSGTSMAAPHVAGALALMQQVSGGNLTADDAERILETTGRKVVDLRNGMWFPRLDVAAAVAATPHAPPPPRRRGVRK
jgi:subtilisin family serine protease